jgi:CheY-like chemotaxis protein
MWTPRLESSPNSGSFCRARNLTRMRVSDMRMVVLVVDDEPDVESLFRQQFRHDLRAGRFEMEFSRSGSAAMDYINDGRTGAISLILSDINMPGMDGIELLRKAKSAKPEVPVIMISAYGDAETRDKALQSGADDLLTKPLDFRALRHAIDKRVERTA